MSFYFRYDFIAVGVGEGQNEALDRIAFWENRIVRVDRFSQLNNEDEESRSEDIFHVLDNPDESEWLLSIIIRHCQCLLTLYKRRNLYKLALSRLEVSL